MIPDIDPSTIENDGERAVFRALASQLPGNWVVRHHYPFCWQDGRRLVDGEADFIVIAPSRGLIVIEVKGSYGFDCVDGKWYRIAKDKQRESAGNPFEQATRVKHRLVSRIAEKVFHTTKEQFPGVYGHVVMYPNGKIEGKLPMSSEPVLMIAYKDMTNVRQRLESAFEAWGGRPSFPELNPEAMEKIVHFFSDSTSGVPLFAAKSEEDDQTIEELTQLQFKSFRGLLGGKRVHVTGPAGSGKTLLARWSAQLLVDRGERILLTCFNRVLAEWLRGIQPADNPVQIESFFSLCRKVVMRAELPWNPPREIDAQSTFWTKTAPVLFDEALGKLPPQAFERYDGIIIDEGQDFHPDWWIPLMLMLKDPDRGRLCIFSDVDQRGVYGRGESYPAGLFPYEMEENCRNTRRIAGYCGKIIKRNISTTYLQPEGSHPTIMPPAEDPRERANLVKSAFSSFTEMGFLPSQVAILSTRKAGNKEGSLTYLTRMHGLPIKGESSDIKDWKNGNCIWASTIKSFKGLEAPCIIMTDVDIGQSEHDELTELYVGATRAKHHLTIIPRNQIDYLKVKTFLSLSALS
jgi:hypothetical protein